MNPLDERRIPLYVPPEEYSAVKSAGGHWDDQAKCWYMPRNSEPAAFSRWLPGSHEDEGYCLSSDAAFVAAAHVPCAQCAQDIEVICLYFDSGRDEETGQDLEAFTASNVWAVDDRLAQQLLHWRHYREVIGEGYFANHCAHCNAVQDDYRLHSEPGDVFFGLSRANPGHVIFAPLRGRVNLSADEGFDV